MLQCFFLFVFRSFAAVFVSTNESIKQRNEYAEKELKTETINTPKVTREEETGGKLNPAQNNKDNEKQRDAKLDRHRGQLTK